MRSPRWQVFVISPLFVPCNLCCGNSNGFADRHGLVYQIILMPRMKTSICNVILMRILSPFVKNTPLRFERFYLFFSSRHRVYCNLLRRCLGGRDAYLFNVWHSRFDWNLQLLSGVKFFNFVRRNIVNVLLPGLPNSHRCFAFF